MMDLKKVLIRKGVKKDLPDVLRLIRELAEYEKALAEVEVTLGELEDDGFGQNRIFEFYVAVNGKEVTGMALYYTKYSTWQGRCIFLDDIVVSEKYRNKGIGTRLFEAIIHEAIKRKVKRLEWQVLDWNLPAIKFYKKYDSLFLKEWLTCRLTEKQLLVLERKRSTLINFK